MPSRLSTRSAAEALGVVAGLDGVNISYSIGKEVYSSEKIAREVRHDEEV